MCEKTTERKYKPERKAAASFQHSIPKVNCVFITIIDLNHTEGIGRGRRKKI